MTRNRADAEDLIHDTTLAFRASHTFQPGTNFKAWYFRILWNCFCSKFRKPRHEAATCQLEDATERYVFQHTVSAGFDTKDTDPARLAIGRLESSQVAAAL
jgi:RNA polymerase sigma-70 factor (ECF subfamily)